MPAPVVGGFIVYLSPLIAVDQGTDTFNVWDGEVPRYDLAGNPVGPTNTQGSWPAVGLSMEEPGFTCGNTFTNNVDEQGSILIQVYATTREESEDLMMFIWQVMSLQISLFTQVDIGGEPGNVNYVAECLLDTWWSGQDANNRTATSQLLYRCDLRFRVRIRTSTPTTT